MDSNQFLKSCHELGYSNDNISEFSKAVEFIHPIFSIKKRFAGDTFLDHNLRVAQTLIENKADPEIITSGLLHGVLEHATKEKISKIFGKSVMTILLEVDELKAIKLKNNKLGSDALRRIILSTIKDVRVILIKLANKLDNLRSVHIFPQKEQLRIAEEVLEIYAPFAYRLGVEKIRVSLEDVAFKIINSRKYNEIAKYLHDSQEQRQTNIADAIKKIKSIAKDTTILKIKGRPKHIYSIYKKIIKRKINLHKQFDLLGIRIIVPDIKDCYTMLGLLHENFEPVPGRLKDYIANPKPNFYRSIHTSVELVDKKIAEIQIRTPEMDEFAEEGLASHWQYKGVKSDQAFERKVSWLKGILDLQKMAPQSEFLDAAKVDLFGDKIYCYTPKGDVKELPKGATLLDFAFIIHEEIGSTCVGGRVNGKFVSIKHKLNSGDVINILTNKKQRPRRSWIKIVQSSKARQKIRKSLKEYEKLPALYFRTFKPLKKEEQGVLIHSEDFPQAVCSLAKCCLPIPGDNVVGIITKRKIVSVHKEECRTAEKEQQRWVPVQWKEIFDQKIRFYVEATERSGVLADLLHTIASSGFEVKEAKAKMIGSDYAQCSFLVIPKDLENLTKLIKRLYKIRGVKKIFFE
jgi:GTP diphosphokinase / guanosine-3',5'-bis(diphosphate) 3'-diphosphatase